MVAVETSARAQAGVPRPSRATRTIPVLALAMSLSLFLAITYVLCVGFDLIFPAQAMHANWERLLPGFTWLTWPGFVLGLIESYAYGWYVALIFGPLYNFFVMQSSAR